MRGSQAVRLPGCHRRRSIGGRRGRSPFDPGHLRPLRQQAPRGHAIASWLGSSGLAGRSGKPWSHKSVLTVLRNRTYLGQVHFRGTWSDATHAPLVEKGLFDAVQMILVERGEDVSKRASNSSDYLLTGLVVCGTCGRRFTGTAAKGRNATYRYYTCGGRQRFGSTTCSADRLPAEALDDAVVRSLLSAYEDSDLFANAVAEAHHRATLGRTRHEGELAALNAELTKTKVPSTATFGLSRLDRCPRHCADSE